MKSDFCSAVVNRTKKKEKEKCQEDHVIILAGDIVVNIIAVRSIWSWSFFPEQTSLVSLRSEAAVNEASLSPVPMWK